MSPRALLTKAGRLLAAGGLVLAAGCMHPNEFDAARTGPFFVPANHHGAPSLGGVRRVAVLPVWGGGAATAETAAELDGIVHLALQQERRFEVVPVPREWLRRTYRVEALASSAALPHDLLARLRSEFAPEAVLFVDVTVYQPYRPLGLGFRAKLAAVDGSRLIWTFDDLFMAEDATVANAARNHFLDVDRRVPADMTHGVLQSPSRFASYAAAAMFATLPPVVAPVVTKR